MPDLRLEATVNGRKITRMRQAASAPARFPARRPQPHRQQGRLRRRRMRHLLGFRRRHADEVVSAAGGQGARRGDRERRVARRHRRIEPAAKGLPQARRQPVRLLHSRHGDGGNRGAARQSICRPGRDQGAARRQYLPLHRLSEDFRRGGTGARRAERPPAGDRARRDRGRRRATSSAATCAASTRPAKSPAGSNMPATWPCPACCMCRCCARRMRMPASCRSTPPPPRPWTASRRVITSADVPGQDGFGVFVNDQPIMARGKVRYVGEAVAAVAADDC